MNENWTPKNPPPELSDTDAELLSAYIDNMLDSQERAALEARLAKDAFLRSELAAMRQMLGWLNTMPTLKAPRNFTLTEADVKAAPPKIVALPRRNYNWQIASAAAVFVLIIGGALLFNQIGLTGKQPESADGIALQSTQTPAEREETTVLYAATEISPILPTLGPPVDGSGNMGGAPEEEAAADSSVERSDIPTTGSDNAVNPTGEISNAQLVEPASSSGSGGNAQGQSGETSTAFGAGGAGGGVGDTQVTEVMLTSTASAPLPITMSTSTAVLSASPTPQPTMNAQAELLVAVTASPSDISQTGIIETTANSETRIFEPSAASTSAGFLPSSTPEAAEESMMTMSIDAEAESTESAVIEESAPQENADDYDASGAVLANESLASRLNAILRRILLDILEN